MHDKNLNSLLLYRRQKLTERLPFQGCFQKFDLIKFSGRIGTWTLFVSKDTPLCPWQSLKMNLARFG